MKTTCGREQTLVEEIWEKAARMSSPEINERINLLLDEILMGVLPQEELEVAKAESSCFAYILLRRTVR